MKTIAAGNVTKLATATGTTPYYVLTMEWPDGTAYYSDYLTTYNSTACLKTLLTLSNLDAAMKADSLGESGQITVKLFDTDDDLKARVKSANTAFIPAKLHIGHIGTVDVSLVFQGRVRPDFIYAEGDRSLELTIESYIEDKEIGYSSTDELSGINKDAIDQAWPLCFGSVLRVPAVPLYKVKKTAIMTTIQGGVSGATLLLEQPFETGTTLGFECEGLHFTGSIVEGENVITFATMNDATHENLTLAARDSGDPLYHSSAVLWLSGNDNIAGKFCLIEHPTNGWAVNLCVAQYGKRCHFIKGWEAGGIEFLPSSSHTIDEAAGFPRTSWGARMELPTALFDFNMRWNWLWNVATDYSHYYLTNGAYELRPTSTITERRVTKDLYVANAIESTEVVEVLAWRKVGNDRKLSPVPSSYFTVDVADTVDGQTCTTIEFDNPLSSYPCEDWEEDIYVSLESSVGSNPADIIKYILETYTSVTVDATTFAAAKTAMTGLPANFALFDRSNALATCEEIAWQAQCAVLIRAGVAYLYYLPDQSTSQLTLSTQILEKTLQITATSLEDIATQFTAKWVSDYSGEETSEKTYIYKNNISRFGVIKRDLDISIYTNEALVKRAVDFLCRRMSNLWRVVRFSTPLATLALDVLDCVTVDNGVVSANALRGIIRSTNVSVDDTTIEYEVQLASRLDDVGYEEPIEDSNFWTIADAGTIPDPLSGLALDDYAPSSNCADDRSGTVAGTSKTTEPEKDSIYQVTSVYEGVYAVRVDDAGDAVGEEEGPFLDAADVSGEGTPLAVGVYCSPLRTRNGKIVMAPLASGGESRIYKVTSVYEGLWAKQVDEDGEVTGDAEEFLDGSVMTGGAALEVDAYCLVLLTEDGQRVLCPLSSGGEAYLYKVTDDSPLKAKRVDSTGAVTGDEETFTDGSAW